MAWSADFSGRRIGPYRLVSLIGTGGMGAVYLGVRDDDPVSKASRDQAPEARLGYRAHAQPPFARSGRFWRISSILLLRACWTAERRKTGFLIS
jgi:hypothetical protein